MPSSSTVVNLLDEDDDDEFARFDQELLRKALLLRTARSSTTTSLPPTEFVHATTSHSQSTILPSSDDGATTTTTTTVANSVPSSATARITSEIQSSPPFSLAESNRLFEEGQSPPLPPLSSSSSSKVSFSGVVDSDNTSRRLTSTQSSPPVVLERGPHFSPPVSSTLSINPRTSITSNPSLVGGRQQRTSIPPASASPSIFSSSSIFGAIGGGEKSRLKSKTGVPFAVVKAKKKSRSGLCRQLCTWLIKMECEI